MIDRITFAFMLAMAGMAPASVYAFNPQPDPPGRYKMASGAVVILTADNHALTVVGGKQTALPPGPCKLENGTTLIIGNHGEIVRSIGSQTGGAGAGKLRL